MLPYRAADTEQSVMNARLLFITSKRDAMKAKVVKAREACFWSSAGFSSSQRNVEIGELKETVLPWFFRPSQGAGL